MNQKLIAVLLALAMTATWAGCSKDDAKRAVRDIEKKAREFVNAERDTTMTRIDEVTQAVNAFYLKLHRYPSGLHELVEPPSDKAEAAVWVKLLDEIPTDAWGTELQYELDFNDAGIVVHVFSCGPDKKPGTDDDLPPRKSK